MKKHILAFTLLANIFCSCQKYLEYTPTGEEGLMSYACTLFCDVVTAPAIAMDIAYEFQNFLNLSDEQRKSHIFTNMVIQYDFNKYALLFHNGPECLIISTHGCELGTPGKGWDIYVESGDLLEYCKIQAPYLSRYSDIPVKIECKADGRWDVSSNARDGVCRLTLADDNPQERVWLAGTSGSEMEDGATGIRADYCTCSVLQEREDFEISFQKHAANDFRTCSFDGTFQVLISSFDEIKERAIVLGKPGFAINCITEICNPHSEQLLK